MAIHITVEYVADTDAEWAILDAQVAGASPEFQESIVTRDAATRTLRVERDETAAP